MDEPCARHVVSENVRVLEAAEALASGEDGRPWPASEREPRSLRDDFDVSTPELDAPGRRSSARARSEPASPGQASGCVVGLSSRDEADLIVETAGRYWAETGHQPRAFVFRAVDGAGRIPPQAVA